MRAITDEQYATLWGYIERIRRELQVGVAEPVRSILRRADEILTHWVANTIQVGEGTGQGYIAPDDAAGFFDLDLPQNSCQRLVGYALGVFSGEAMTEAERQDALASSRDCPAPRAGLSTGRKVVIGVGVAAGLGLLGWFIWR